MLRAAPLQLDAQCLLVAAAPALRLLPLLPQIAAAGTRELWLAWIDALIAFEGSLGRSGLLGCYWEVADARDLPVLLLRGSTLSVFGEDPAWLVSEACATVACTIYSVWWRVAAPHASQELVMAGCMPLLSLRHCAVRALLLLLLRGSMLRVFGEDPAWLVSRALVVFCHRALII